MEILYDFSYQICVESFITQLYDVTYTRNFVFNPNIRILYDSYLHKDSLYLISLKNSITTCRTLKSTIILEKI